MTGDIYLLCFAFKFVMVFTMRIFDSMPGVPGLVVAAVFASSLRSADIYLLQYCNTTFTLYLSYYGIIIVIVSAL